MTLTFSELVLAVLTAGGGSAVVAFAVFRFFGENWMNSLFAQRLEAYRHENAKELQSLRAEIDGVLNVRLRVQEKEFEVLAECWDTMNIAFGATQSYVSPMQSYPDISRMDDEAREEYLSSIEIFNFQKKEVMRSANPSERLIELLDLKKRNDAGKAHAVFHNTVNKYEIFMSEELAKNFKSVSAEIRSAIVSKEVARQAKDWKMGNEAWKSLEEKCSPKVEQISEELRLYLRSSLSAAASKAQQT